MDVSIFIGNKRRFWSWILLPLILRLVSVGVVFGFTEKPLARCEEEGVSKQVIGILQLQCDTNNKLLARYEIDPIFPVNEQLYQLVVEKNSEYGVNLTTDIRINKNKKGKVSVYSLLMKGDLPSVYVMIDLLADMLVQ